MGWQVRLVLISKNLLINFHRKTLLILDKEGRIVAILVGQPDDPEWLYVINDAAEVMQEVQRLGAESDLFSEKSLAHRQGEFLAIPVGVSFGGGQVVIAYPVFHEDFSLMNSLCRSREILSIIGQHAALSKG